MLVWLCGIWYCINISTNALAQRFAWGGGGGSITGMQCFLKDALIVLNLSRDKRPWKLPLTFYILIVLGITCAVTGLAILTRCMKRYDVTFSNAMNSGKSRSNVVVVGCQPSRPYVFHFESSVLARQANFNSRTAMP